jgi:hypothetical protein
MTKQRIGNLPPQYTFILNPYAGHRFTRCPNCERQMKQRKLPLFIHVDPANPVALNYTCRYCPHCDLLIAHQDEIETLLAQLFAQYNPSLIGNDYLVLGTLERRAWQASFKEVQTIRVQPAGWYPNDVDPSELPVQEPAPLDTPWRSQRPPSGKDARPREDRPGAFPKAKPHKPRRRRRP